jgi:hypothetical protein
MNHSIKPTTRLPDVREQIEYEGDSARSVYVHAYFRKHADLFGVTPYANLDTIAPGSIRRGDYWAWKEMPIREWSEETPGEVVIKQGKTLLVVEVEHDVADFERHGHLTGKPGVFRGHDIAEVDMVVAGTDHHGRADRIRRKYGVPVFIIEEMDNGPSFTEFVEQGGWK